MLLASRVQPPPEGHQIGARKRRGPEEHHPQPTTPPPRPLNREDSQLTASLESEPGPTPFPDPLTLIPQNQVLEGEGTRLELIGGVRRRVYPVSFRRLMDTSGAEIPLHDCATSSILTGPILG